jgi:hypothetical protein
VYMYVCMYVGFDRCQAKFCMQTLHAYKACMDTALSASLGMDENAALRVYVCNVLTYTCLYIYTHMHARMHIFLLFIGSIHVIHKCTHTHKHI